MVLFFTSTLIISVVGMLLLLLLKQVELSTGSVILANARPGINRFFKTCLVLVERVLPALLHNGVVRLMRRIKVFVQKLLAYIILHVEAWMKQTLHTIREKLHPEVPRGEASAFLKEVGDYKKQLEAQAEEGARDL